MKWKKKGCIFTPDTSKEWSQSHAQVPLVEERDKHTLRVYYGSRDAQNRTRISYFDVDASNPASLLYSHDQPLLPLGDIGHFDDSGVMPSDIVKREDNSYLYYVGWNTGTTSRYRTAIGLATSSDNGATFEKVASGPILDRSMDDPVSISCQSVLYQDGKWQTWYMSYTQWIEVDGVMEPVYEIKYAESENGIYWVRDNITCISLAEEEGGVACPSVIHHDGMYKMWYSVRGRGDYRKNSSQSYRIGYAESVDGLQWQRLDEKAGITVSESGWDSEMIAYPYVIDVNDSLLLFYNGNGFGQSGIGYAVLS